MIETVPGWATRGRTVGIGSEGVPHGRMRRLNTGRIALFSPQPGGAAEDAVQAVPLDLVSDLILDTASRARAGESWEPRVSVVGAQRGDRARLAWKGYIRFPADRIHKAAVEALAPGAIRPLAECEREGQEGERRSRWGYEFETRSRNDRLSGVLAFRQKPDPEIRKLLEPASAILVKAQYALWARAFAEGSVDRGTVTRVSLSALCDDLGYERLRNGAHRPHSKRQAARIVDLLARLHLQADYTAPDGRRCTLEGPLWSARLIEDGARRGTVLEYAPGSWFLNEIWRRYNGRVGLAGAGLLGLRADRDRWAILFGGYLGALARMNGYRPLTLGIRTLLERSGLARSDGRNPARMSEKLERGLDRLREAGVIGGWDWLGGSGPEPDMDLPSDLARLSGAAAGWMERRIRVEWPMDLSQREQRLRTSRNRRR